MTESKSNQYSIDIASTFLSIIALYFVYKFFGWSIVERLKEVVVVSPLCIWCAWKGYKRDQVFIASGAVALTFLLASRFTNSSNNKEILYYLLKVSMIVPTAYFYFGSSLSLLFVHIRKKFPKINLQ